MKKDLTKFQELFGDSVRLKVLEFFLEAENVSFPIEAIVEDKKIGKSQVYEIVKEFVKKKYLLKDKVFNKRQLYILNTKNSLIESVRDLFKKVILN